MSTVHMVHDPSPYLQPVVGTGCGSQINAIRTNAGVVFGFTDSIVNMIAGFSPLDEWVLKPLAGDWVAMDRAAAAWRNEGMAINAIKENIDALPRQVGSSWNGSAMDEWCRLDQQIAATLGSLPQACAAMGDFADALAQMARAIGDMIAQMLGIIADTVTRILIQQAIPVIGQAAGVAETGVLVVRTVDYSARIAKATAQFMKAVDMTMKILKEILTLLAALEKLANGIVAAGAAGATVKHATGRSTAFVAV